MGQAPSRILPPAEEVTDAPYDLKAINAPVFAGTALRLFVHIAESVLFLPIRGNLARQSNIPQMLRETHIPEPPTFEPLPPHPPATAAAAAGERVLSQEDPPSLRVLQAVDAIPGFKVLRTTGEEPCHTRRWAVADYHQAYVSGEATPSQVAENVIGFVAAAASSDPPMQFFVTYYPEDVRRQAAASTQRYKEGKPLSALDGVPYVVKDCIDALPYPTSLGTAHLASSRPVVSDHAMVAAIRATGAILLGKTVMVEVGLGTTGLNTVSGTPRNPYNPAHFTGGSSSGTAAAVSAGLAPIGIGHDGGGSVRIPASLCGIFGLKTSFGRDSKTGGPDNAFTVTSSGPMTAYVEDAMLLYAACANAGIEGQYILPAPSVTIPRSLFDAARAEDSPLKGVRLGVYSAWFEDAQPEVVTICSDAVAALESLGAEVVSICIPDLELQRVAHTCTISSEILRSMLPALQNKRTRAMMTDDVRVSLSTASMFGAGDYVMAQKVRTRMMRHLARVLKDVDFVASPATPITAPRIPPAALRNGMTDLTTVGCLMRFAQLANMCGNPAVSIPVGYDSQGLPVGLQLVGQPWGEAALLRVSSVLEAKLAPAARLPAVSYDPLFNRPLKLAQEDSMKR